MMDTARELEQLTDDDGRRLVADVLQALRGYFARAGASRGGATRAQAPPLEGAAARRETRLREWRREEARRLGVSAFLVLTNRSLREIAERDPTTLAELGEIHGLGEKKLETLGRPLLRLLKRQRGKAA